MPSLRIALAQINTTVGDLSRNTEKIINALETARKLGVDIIAFPELAICGYPPEDLLFKTQFIEKNLQCLKIVKDACKNLTAIVGYVDREADIYNAAAIIHDRQLVGIYHKIFLPNYGVFDENRYFRAGNQCPVYIINGVNLGVSICEDIWYEDGPPTTQASAGAEVLINISASPYHVAKGESREKMLQARASDNISHVVFINLVGGQDELVFDGNSMVINQKGEVIAHARSFTEDFLLANINTEPVFSARLHDPRYRKSIKKTHWPVTKTEIVIIELTANKPPLGKNLWKPSSHEAEIYGALVLGTHDYVFKNGFKKVVIGLSGGIDSALVATIAVDALGASRVTGVAMPSRYSSPRSLQDAEILAKNLGIEFITLPFDTVYQSYLDILQSVFKRAAMDVTEENIQARIRGNLLMALSNKFGWLVLTTGNKSEMATGYTTLYGDMAGGFAVIKDVFKSRVYKLAKYRNSLGKKKIIPATIIDKAPSAELRPGQKDTDSLPSYEILDPILKAYVEEDRSIAQITNTGFAEDLAKRIARLVDTSEYKRRQAPPGIKITPRAFGKDRRLPITNGFKEYA